MKKFLTFMLLFFSLSVVNAESNCSYQERANLNSKASNIKVNYEAINEFVGLGDVGYYNRYINVYITNVLEEFYVVVTNDFNNVKKTFKSSDAINGVISFKWENISQTTNMSFEVFTTSKTNCANEKYKTLRIVLPRYNKYSERAICDNYKDYYLCESYVTLGEVSEKTFVNKINEYIAKKDKEIKDEEIKDHITITDKIFTFIDNYKFIIIGSVLVLVVVVVIVKRINNKKQGGFKI